MWAKIGLSIAVLTVLSGCASPTVQTQAVQDKPEASYLYNSPEDTPREQWSTALTVVHELMGIRGLKDVVSTEPFGETTSHVPNWNGADGLAVSALGAVSPTTHISAGGGLAIGAGLFLLGGSNPGPLRLPQAAFWVPVDMAANATEAAQVAAQAWAEAKTKVTGRHQRVDYVITAAYPSGHGEKYGSLRRIATQQPVPFEGEPQRIDYGGLNGEFYGPIFIDGQIPVYPSATHRERYDGPLLLQRRAERLKAIADALPSWAAVYAPPSIAARLRSPAAVVFNNEVHYFVAPSPRASDSGPVI